MKVAVDARSLNREHVRGIGKYLWNVLTNVSSDEEVNWNLFGDRPDLPCHPPSGHSIELFDPPGYRFHSWEQLGFPRRAKQIQADIVHYPQTTISWWQPKPSVVTIHDTVPWDGNDEFSQSWYWWRLLPAAYRKCAAIITISESSRRDILSHWPGLESKLHVIHHGIEPHYLDPCVGPNKELLNSYRITSPYFLYFGGAIPRKRLDWAIKVWTELGENSVQLVACGIEQSARERILSEVPEKFRSSFIMAPFVPEEEMPRLIQNAVAVLYPTLYEGFGLPALESQAVGTPVLFSAVGSLIELEGPASHILPTDDLEAWVQTCRQLLSSRREFPEPIEEARAWAQQFSWDESARKHIELYRSVAGESQNCLSTQKAK